jgi:hypothetical protein
MADYTWGDTIIRTTAQWNAHLGDIIPIGVKCIEILDTNEVTFKIGNDIKTYDQLPSYVTQVDGLEIGVFTPNTLYKARTVIIHNGDICVAKRAFTSTSVFQDDDWYINDNVYTKESLDSLLSTKLDSSKANISLVGSASVSRTAGAYKLDLAKVNPLTSDETSEKITLPLVSESLPGIATPGMVQQLAQNEADIVYLKNGNTLYLADFDSLVDSDNPTQSELTDLYHTVSGKDEAPINGTTLVRSDNDSIKYTWYETVSEWRVSNTQVPKFKENQPGIIVGATEAEKGKIFGEADGKGSLVGWDELTEGEYPSQGIRVTDATGSTESLDHLVKLEKLTDTYEGNQEEKNILNLKVTKEGALQTIDGLAINGVRIDYDYKSLKIKTAKDEISYDLLTEYKFTSSFASIEMYNKLFIFDEETAGKGLIKDENGDLHEVTDLGIYAPESTVNVIHVYDPDHKDVCFILNEKTQSKTLIVYPDGTYKVVDFLNAARTPQNISEINLLTSLDGNRHSYLMRQSHTMNTNVNATSSELILFQLEDCSFRILDASSKACDGNAGTLNMATYYGNLAIAWEGHEDLEDFEPNTKLEIDTAYADNINGNKRLPYKTGQWQSERGSILKDRPGRQQHNHIYHFDKGAQILCDDHSTSLQHVLVTPEGFIGWFTLPKLSYYYYRDWREVEIKSGDYAGKRGIFFYSIDQNSQCHFIVNTPDGDPDKTVCVALKTDLNNLNHANGKNPIGAAFVSYPTRPFVDYNRIYAHWQNDASNSRYFVYLNQAEITPNTFNTTWTQHFDYHILDAVTETGYASATFNSYSWAYMDRIDFIPNKGTLVYSQSNPCDLFLPDAADEWDSENNTWANRPYYILHAGNEATTIAAYSSANLFWMKPDTMRVFWHDHVIRCLNATVGYARDYYLNSTTGKLVEKQITYSAMYGYTPYVLDNKHMIIWSGENQVRCVALTWNNATNDYTVTDGGVWLPPVGNSGSIVYKNIVSQLNYDFGERNTLYFFPARYGSTSTNEYLGLSYAEDGDGNSIPQWNRYSLPKAMNVRHIIQTPLTQRVIITNAAADTNVYMITLKSGTSTSISYPDSTVLEKIYDISNLNNPEESPWGAYAMFSNTTSSYMYILEWDYVSNTASIVKYNKRANVTSRLYALPPRVINEIPLARFAIGANYTTASTASSPFTIIERLGGTLDAEHPVSVNFTSVRDFGTTAYASARVDLAVPARLFTQPHLCYDGAVRFMAQKTQNLGDYYSNDKDVALLGYKYSNDGTPNPVYGAQWKLRDTGSDYTTELANTDGYFIEIGTSKERDSMIFTGQDFGYALKLADGWEVHKADKEFALGSTFKGGNPTGTIWGSYTDADLNYLYGQLEWVIIENQIVTSTVTGHVASQYTHEAGINPYSLTNTVTGAYGWANYLPVIRKHRILFLNKTLRNGTNLSYNTPPVIIDMDLNSAIAAIAAAGYTTMIGNEYRRTPMMQQSAATPLYQYFENQILPGIYHRRDNQKTNPYTGGNQQIIPYFVFNENVGGIFDGGNIGYSLTTTDLAHTDLYKKLIRYNGTLNKIYLIPHYVYPSNDKVPILVLETNNNVTSIKEVGLTNIAEVINQATYLNGYIELTSDTRHYKLDIETDTIERTVESPSTNAIIHFSKGTDLIELRDGDGNADKYYVFSKNNLVLEYQGNQFYNIPLKDILIKGNNTIEDLIVPNKLKTNTIEAAKIYVESSFPRLVI